jgi:hypothetical protein
MPTGTATATKRRTSALPIQAPTAPAPSLAAAPRPAPAPRHDGTRQNAAGDHDREGSEEKTTSKTATFDFGSNESGSTFECSLDSSPFRPCTSPHTVRAGKPGKHDFQVRARDAAGNLDQSAATYSWTVKGKKHRHHAR